MNSLILCCMLLQFYGHSMESDTGYKEESKKDHLHSSSLEKNIGENTNIPINTEEIKTPLNINEKEIQRGCYIPNIPHIFQKLFKKCKNFIGSKNSAPNRDRDNINSHYKKLDD